MANTRAATSSDPGRVTDPEAVEELCNQYVFEDLNWKLNEDDEFGIWGYGDLHIYHKADEDDPERIDFDRGLRTREFLRKLSQYIAEGESVEIQTTGFMKCRYREMVASMYVVRREQLLRDTLGDPTPLPPEEQPLSDE